ncbi:4-hydroxythreonine-4-phosphate dehydrogenase PdxA [Verrucomicrobiota bacterium]
MNKPLIAVTMGDPAGIGPELCLKILQEPQVLDQCVPVVFGDSSVLDRVASAIGVPRPENIMPLADFNSSWKGRGGLVVDCRAIDGQKIKPGQIQKDCGRAAYTYIETSIKAVTGGSVAAVVTNPINKYALNLAGLKYPGHTEIFAELTGAERFCMMFVSEGLAVSLVTIHVGYAEVCNLLTERRIVDVIELTADAIKQLGVSAPKIVVCGLNPHAGEGGLFGREEKEIIEPAIELARSKGINVEGPLPADTAFLPDKRGEVDGYVTMFHDQGLIPFKMLAFDKGVNITLGLPIVRTSVDHGTAFDIAWQGKASAGSLIQAISYAIRLRAVTSG